MKNTGIVCEYNPYHAGHEHHMHTLRAEGAECIICVMSGNFTQRGGIAIADKYTRAKTAVDCGADIVLELPFPYSSISAEGFSRAGVYILDAIGADTISFGSECGDLSLMCEASRVISSPEFSQKYAQAQRDINASTSAYFEAYKQLSGIEAEFMSNDLLGISYIRAINELGLGITPHTIKRTGAAYNDTKLSEGYPSATALRKLIYEDKLDNCKSHMPQRAFEALASAKEGMLFPADENKFFSILQSFFRLHTPSEIKSRATALCGGASVLDDGDGIVERICTCAANTNNINNFYAEVASTRYTNSRISRVILYSLLGVSDTYRNALPSYTLLLGASDHGREYLKKIRKSVKIQIVTKPADMPDSIDAELSRRADSLYSLLLPSVKDSGYFLKKNPYIQ